MQNTIVKEFENHPQGLTFIWDQGGWFEETRAWCETFWDNYYLRGSILYEESGDIGWQYNHPAIGIPFGRSFILAPDGTVYLPYFGHHPQLIIQEIYKLLGKYPDEQNAPKVLA